MTVWMLANGEDEEYSVVGIFSSRQKADHARAVRRRLADHDPEEVEVDDPRLLAEPEAGFEIGPVYRVRVEMGDGRVSDAGWVEGWYRHPTDCRIEVDDYGVVVYSPASEEHAIEVAVARRLAWLFERGRLRIEFGGRAER